MPAIKLSLIPHASQTGMAYQHLRIQLVSPDGIVEPRDLVGLALPQNIQWRQGVVLEGKAPIWLYGYLVHECHPAAWVGCYDPRLGGAVVIETHTKAIALGSVILLILPD